MSERTVKQYIKHIERLRKFSNGMVSKEVISAFFEEINRKFCSSYVRDHLKALRIFFRDFAKRPELIEHIKWAPIPPPRFIQLPTREQLRRAFEALKKVEHKAIFLFYATTGLRRSEVLNLKLRNIIWEHRAVIPEHNSKTKKAGISFFNEEAEFWLRKYLSKRKVQSEKLFVISDKSFKKLWRIASEAAGVKITPQVLRKWHAVQLRVLGVPDSFIDIFQGRAPRSVLARYYTPVGIQELKQVYDKAGLRILD